MSSRSTVLLLLSVLPGCASGAGRDGTPGTHPSESMVSRADPGQSGATATGSPWSPSVPTEGGTYRVAWRPLGPGVPKNEYFELEVEVRKEGELFREGRLVVDADMPEHGHGMNVSPRALQQTDGRWRVKGMLLHMGGYWVLELGVLTVGAPEKARFEIQLP